MLNEAEYREATQKRDWKKIFDINKVVMDSFGTKKEFLALGGLIEDDETVYAFASGIVSQSDRSNGSDFGANTWLVALTSERILFVDCALLSDSIDTQTVRLNRVQAVSASQGWLLGKIMLATEQSQSTTARKHMSRSLQTWPTVSCESGKKIRWLPTLTS
jgi:hypothetical protein